MITLNYLFYLFIVLFAIIGAMRGWAKELLVTFSVILSIFIILVLEKWVQPINVLFGADDGSGKMQFISQTLISAHKILPGDVGFLATMKVFTPLPLEQ